jgi:RimJ/RimL family protein N-acetyltransferase
VSGTTTGRAPESFTTARLRAERPTGADEDFLVATWTDPRVTAWLGGPRDAESVRGTLARWDRLWDEQGYGPWMLFDRESGDAVGWVLLHPIVFGGTVGGIEVGWTIVADRWREGLATEAAARVVDIAFSACGLDDLVSGTMTDNAASRGVMEKVGFRFDRELEHAGLPHVVYRLDRETWEQRNDG